MMSIISIISLAWCWQVDGIKKQLGSYSSLPYPDVSSNENVIVENTEIIIKEIEEYFVKSRNLQFKVNVESILETLISSNEPYISPYDGLNELSVLMRSSAIDTAVLRMKTYTKDSLNPSADGSSRVVRQFVDMLSVSISKFKKTDPAERLQATKMLNEALKMFKSHILNFFDIDKRPYT